MKIYANLKVIPLGVVKRHGVVAVVETQVLLWGAPSLRRVVELESKVVHVPAMWGGDE
jgi:hypothetical protein